MRAIVTGQVGVDKKPFLEAVAAYAQQQSGHEQRGRDGIGLFHVGDRMYAEAPDVRPGKILGLPLSRLNALRRAVFRDAINDAGDHEHYAVNTHATFRWRHGLFSAFDFDQVRTLNPDVFVCLVDNIEVVHHRLHAEHEIDATLKDCMVWREEEILATELMAQAATIEAGNNTRHHAGNNAGGTGNSTGRFYIVSRGRGGVNVRTLYRLLTQPDTTKVYPSFPMSHVLGMPDVQAEIDAFRNALADRFITFDPGDVDEKMLLDTAIAAAKEGRDFVEVDPTVAIGADTLAENDAERIRVSVRQVLDIAGDIDGQIYMRDFKLIDQADMIVSYVPELENGTPGLSSGVERELQHAFEHAKDVYVVWKPTRNPSPFITETATRVFRSTEEALAFFRDKGLCDTAANGRQGA